MYVCIYIYIYIYIYTIDVSCMFEHACLSKVFLHLLPSCMLSMVLWLCKYTYIYTYLRTCVNVYIYVCMYVCMCVYIYIYIYIYIYTSAVRLQVWMSHACKHTYMCTQTQNTISMSYNSHIHAPKHALETRTPKHHHTHQHTY
jgi:hypothetical protein